MPPRPPRPGLAYRPLKRLAEILPTVVHHLEAAKAPRAELASG
jgi:hypothetical protein